jgi:hypothetical protein
MGSGWIRGTGGAVVVRGAEQNGWKARCLQEESRQSYKKGEKEREKETEEIKWDWVGMIADSTRNDHDAGRARGGSWSRV